MRRDWSRWTHSVVAVVSVNCKVVRPTEPLFIPSPCHDPSFILIGTNFVFAPFVLYCLGHSPIISAANLLNSSTTCTLTFHLLSLNVDNNQEDLILLVSWFLNCSKSPLHLLTNSTKKMNLQISFSSLPFC